MRHLRVFGMAALAIGLALACASAPTTRYDYDRTANFSQFHTYRWVDVEGAEKPNQLTDQAIKQAIDNSLSTKGLRRTDGDDADLYVAYQVSIQQEHQINTYSTGGYGWGGYYGSGWGMGSQTSTTSTIHVGTLVFDMYDHAKKQLVWRGTASKTLDPSPDPEKTRARLQEAMDKMLETYPPPPPKA